MYVSLYSQTDWFQELSIRKRLGIKQAQQEYLEDVIKEGNLPVGEQVDWLIKEHMKNQGTLEKLYDDEVSRQRMVLEEKLAKRRALAAMAVSGYNTCNLNAAVHDVTVLFIHQENEEDADSDKLNTVADQHFSLIKRAKKYDVIFN